MNNKTFVRGGGLLIAAGLSAALLAACVPPPKDPERVASTNPTVTYDYTSDQQLLTAREDATRFCRQYQASPQVMNMSSNPNAAGAPKKVVFECVAMASSTPGAVQSAPPAPDMAYTYRTDAELLQASSTAQTYCARQGQRASATVTPNADGSRTVAFRCVQ